MKNGTLKYCIDKFNKTYDTQGEYGNRIIFRRDLRDYDYIDSTIDSYRNDFSQAGYLENVGRGEYKVLKRIPENLTLFRLLTEAYPRKYPNSEHSPYFKKELLIERYKN